LAGAADTLAKRLTPAKNGHDLICSTKAKHGPTFENFVQRSVLLIYTLSILFYSVRCCGINQLTNTQENAIQLTVTFNAWSQITSHLPLSYEMVEHLHHMNVPTQWETKLHDHTESMLAYRLTTLLLAGDLQLNPGPVYTHELQPPAGALSNQANGGPIGTFKRSPTQKLHHHKTPQHRSLSNCQSFQNHLGSSRKTKRSS